MRSYWINVSDCFIELFLYLVKKFQISPISLLGDTMTIKLYIQNTAVLSIMALSFACSRAASDSASIAKSIKSFSISNIQSNKFSAKVETANTLESSDKATLYYCNHTKVPDCDPRDWYGIEMDKSGQDFIVDSPTFKFPDDPQDEMNVTVKVEFGSDSVERQEVVKLDGPSQIYRSIGVGTTTALETRTSSGTNEAVIADSTITFDSNVALNIGIGDAIVVDHDTPVGFEDIFFIRKRIAANQFLLNDKDGEELSSDFSTITDWQIFRAYSSLPDSNEQTENTGIPVEVRDFDTSRDAVSDNRAWHFAFYADAAWNLTTSHVIGGWTLSGDNYLRYFVPFLSTEVGTTQRHQGQWDSSKALITLVADGDYSWPFMQRFSGKDAVRVEGFQFQLDSNGYDSVYAYRFDSYQIGAENYLYFHNNIVKGVGSGGGSDAVSVSGDGLKAYIFANIAYDNDGTAFSLMGEDTIASHNTSYNNHWNFLSSNSWPSTALANISMNANQYYYRGAYLSGSVYNISGVNGPPGESGTIENALDSEVSFVSTAFGSENLCITDSSIAYILGPKMINESDPYKIYYDAAGNVRNPNDLIFPLGACSL